MESLVKAGVMDNIGSRGALLNSVAQILSLAQREQKLRETGQTTMFDMFGESAPVPLATLDMAPAETSDREKAFWEKELMGVSFSEKPFSPVFSGVEANTSFCGQIDEESEGQSIIIAGRVVSARYLLTKDGRSFCSAVLEDFSGQVEVMVWPKVFADSEELWQEGNELIVQGKVRIKDDKPQISCDRVSVYAPEEEQAKTVAPEPKTTKANGASTKINGGAVKTNGIPKAPPPPEKHRLTINLTQTADEEGDTIRLNRIKAILQAFPGRDEVLLNIAVNGNVEKFKLPVYTSYCPELKQRLDEFMGQGGFTVETLA
jgi:DNA polymerase-3 subunit alpha